ncbi:hypothetical protein AAFF_G00038490 [Aldrovandia affinis]|uniref:Reverse transcriptase domain-containing protein n=1 Tax=Aldrovandia affinis TaxID=143900 RepID=A0AAD7T562_9TELE|nr:hypothetical protein AAFF_G00038490 [Aldrovandia affinis]
MPLKPLTQPQRPPKEDKTKGHRPSVKWPKAVEKKEWETINNDLTKILEQQGGTAEKKLERMGDIIYHYGEERFGVSKRSGKALPTPAKSRRQQEIERLVRERRQLRKQWKKASDAEREGLTLLQGDIKCRLAILRRTENLRKPRRKKEHTRTQFYKNPFKFVKDLFTKEKNGILKISKQELEEHLEKVHSDTEMHEQIVIPHDIPPIQPPEFNLDTGPPKWKELENAVQRARAASAPGPNGVPYKLYKNTPDVLRFLWRLMRVVWQKKIIPKAWRRAGGVLIPKEKDASDISQFRPICLLNVEGKLFYSIVARRLSTYLERNKYVDTSVQKAGIPGFSGCLEHTSMIWHQIQAAKKDKRDLHIVFLDLANAFGSVPHELLWESFNFFHVPEPITTLVKAYFQDLQLCFTTANLTTTWQRLEIGIMAGCTISPLAFTMAMEVIIRASKWVVGGERTKNGLRLPPIRAYMDDMTTLTTTAACTRRLLGKLQENIKWARVKIKPNKSRSISIIKGELKDVSLKDKEQVQQLRQDIVNGLDNINKTLLPGKLKLWCLQFGLLPRIMWPLTIYEVPITTVEKMERTVTSYVKKWLGVPRCLTNISLYSKGVLELPLTSLTEEYKCSKVRLQMTLKDSRDQTISNAALPLLTGWKWTPSDAVQQATSALRHKDIVGHVQQGRGGFGLAAREPTWRKASTSERRKLVVEEVRREEETARSAKAVSLAKQGQWMRWEGMERRKISWKELWEIEASNISFIIRATYDVLPSPKNLHQWYGEDPTCALCPTPATLGHIMTGCKISLTQGRYTWRHNQVLKNLASALENKRSAINALPSRANNPMKTTTFIREGQERPKHPSIRPETGMGGPLGLWTWSLVLILACPSYTVPVPILAGAKVTGLDGGGTQGDLELATEYLQHYYNLKGAPLRRRKRSDSALSSKLRDMQSFFGLNATGDLDSETLAVMRAPRCGVADVQEYTNQQGNKWAKTVISYNIGQYTSDLPSETVDSEIESALNVWSKASPLKFVKSPSRKADILVDFATKAHGDSYPFDGPRGTLAHAYGPGSGIGGDTHFDDAETWTNGSTGFNLFLVAVHETGTHKTCYLEKTPPRSTLSMAKQLQQHQRLPGKTPAAPRNPFWFLPRRFPFLMQDKCNPNLAFDAVTSLGDTILFFRDRYMWIKYGQQCDIKEGPIHNFLPKIQSGIDAAYSIHRRSSAYLFKGTSFWTVRGSQVRGRPKPIHRFGLPKQVKQIDAAVHVNTTGHTLIFIQDLYWRYNENRRAMEDSYPRNTSKDFPGIKIPVDAAVYKDGFIHFFHGPEVHKFDDSQKRIVEIDKVNSWLGCEGEPPR